MAPNSDSQRDYAEEHRLSSGGLPVLDLNSGGPLPAEWLKNEPRFFEDRRKKTESLPIDGMSLLCHCPDCGAPMTVRNLVAFGRLLGVWHEHRAGGSASARDSSANTCSAACAGAESQTASRDRTPYFGADRAATFNGARATHSVAASATTRPTNTGNSTQDSSRRTSTRRAQ